MTSPGGKIFIWGCDDMKNKPRSYYNQTHIEHTQNLYATSEKTTLLLIILTAAAMVCCTLTVGH